MAPASSASSAAAAAESRAGSPPPGGGSGSASETAALIRRLLRQKSRRLTEGEDASRLDELRRTFARLIADGELRLAGSSSSSAIVEHSSEEVKSKWSAWLLGRHEEFVSQLTDRVRSGRRSSLRTFCGVVASSPVPVAGGGGGGGKMIDERLLRRLVESLAFTAVDGEDGDDGGGGGGGGADDGDGEADESMLALLEREFLGPHHDVRYFALRAVRGLADGLYRRNDGRSGNASEKGGEARRRARDGVAAENLLRILMKIEVAGSDEELESEGAFLIPPPPPVKVAERDEDSEVDDDEEEDDDNAGGSSSEDESDEDDDDDDDDAEAEGGGGRKRKRSGGASSSSKKPRRDAGRPYWQLARRHRRALQETWLAVLKLPVLPPRALKRALRHLPSSVLSVVPEPLRFSDFFSRSYDLGGMTSVLALEGLFVLMTRHGLEYPKFYASLYKLVDARILYARHRARFLRLLSTCLSRSDMLPAYTVAAFCKRLCRSALSAPPPGALFAVALTSNLLRRHGEAACLVHRGGGRAIEDKFDPEADDPAHAGALESSLWELEALGRHYHPAVAALAESCGTEADDGPMHDLEELLAQTYGSLFEAERKRGDQRKRRKVPLTFEEPKGLFVEGDVFDGLLHLPEKST